MTTIAYRDGIMAADSLVTNGYIAAASCEKIVRVPFGQAGDKPLDTTIYRHTSGLAAASGHFGAAERFLRWARRLARNEQEWIAPESEDATGLLVDLAGTVWLWTGAQTLSRVEGQFFAIGSGGNIALGAMAMGASAEEAVKHAAAFDVYTGGRIITLALAPSPPRSPA